MKIKSGDKIRVLSGKEKGKEGTVLQVFVKPGRIVVEGINMATRHLRSRVRDQSGQKIQFPSPLYISNVQLISSKTGVYGRVGYKYIEQGSKIKKIRVLRRKGIKEDVE